MPCWETEFAGSSPLGFRGGDCNLYRYVGNSPTDFIDPDGLEAARPKLQPAPTPPPPRDMALLDPGSSKKDDGKTGDHGDKRKKGILGTLATWGYYFGALFDSSEDFTASDLHDAINDLEKSLEPGQKIGTLTIKGHGSEGRIGLGGSSITIESFSPGSKHYDDLQRLRELLDKDNGKIVILECSVLGGKKGDAFGRIAAKFFGVTVGGHTETICWPFMPGYQEYDYTGKKTNR